MGNLLKVAKANVSEMREKQVKNLVSAINKEAVSIGAVIRSIVAIAYDDASENCGFANLVLDTICKKANAAVAMSINAIKKEVIACYPYKNEANELLQKKDGLYVKIEKFDGRLIKRAYYASIGVTKIDKDFRQATAEEVAKVEKAREDKKAEKAKDKKEAELQAKGIMEFYEELMKAQNDTDIIRLVRSQQEIGKKSK